MAGPPTRIRHDDDAVSWRLVAGPAQKVALEACEGQVSTGSLRALETVIKDALRASSPMRDIGQSSELDLSSTGPAEVAGANLAAREVQVLKGVAAGLSNAQIGERLWITEQTVKTHLHRIFDKIGATCRAHAVAIAFRYGALR